ncbi:MAG: hypothetical protein ACKVQW_12550 [Pyrinomonadaceae bacterium]
MNTMCKEKHVSHFSAKGVAVSVLISLLFLGLPINSQAQSSQPFTGEQVFRGVLFGEAPVSQLLPEVWGSDSVAEQLDTKEKVKAWDAMKEGVVSHINTNHPDFMARFGTEMQSGSHSRIQAAMVEAGEKTREAMISMGVMNQNGEFSSTYSGAMACSAVAVCVAAVAVAVWKWVALVDIAAVVMVAAVALAVWRWGPRGRSGFSSSETEGDPAYGRLFQETLVDTIAEKLDAAS